MATMMPVEIDKFCANCVMHNWKQPDDIGSLINCPGCRLIKYCGEACKKEHWRKVHKNYCQFLTDPTKCPQSQHDAETCANCRPATGTGDGKRKMAGRAKKKNPTSFSYECFTKDIHFPPGLPSPHPFPLAGVEDDLLEKSIIVMQYLVHKLKQNPRVVMMCSAELEEMEMFLWSKRRDIWGYRKVLSQRQIVYLTLDFGQFLDLVKSLTAKVSYGKAGKDATELWKTIYLVLVVITGGISTYRQLEVLKNPIDNIPEQFRDLVKLALDNKSEFHDIVEEIIDSLSTRVIPYDDIVKKLCGGKKRQKCSFCGVKIEVTEYIYIEEYDKTYCDRRCSSVLFDALSIRIFTCGSQDCHTKVSSLQDDKQKLSLAVLTACNERNGVRCDYCFQLCPIDLAHRCCNCLTVMYCSKSCHKEDKEKHSRKYCIEDERKTKGDRSMRRQMGEITPAKMAAMAAGSVLENRKDMLNEALEAFHFEDSKSKKEDGDPVTEREQDTSIPEAATVPAGEDKRSKSATGAAPNAEHVNDRSRTGAGATATERAHGKSASGAEAAGGNSISEVD